MNGVVMGKHPQPAWTGGWIIDFFPLNYGVRDYWERAPYLLQCAVVFGLLTACANVANLHWPGELRANKRLRVGSRLGPETAISGSAKLRRCGSDYSLAALGLGRCASYQVCNRQVPMLR